MTSVEIDPHPLSRPVAFTTVFPTPLERAPPAAPLVELLRLRPDAPLAPDEPARAAVRAMLRHGGYKPSGRGKPASEYLARAAEDGSLGSINLAVDACNAVSLHSGIPISVIDLDRAAAPFRVRLGAAGESYAFNTAGQVIDLEGLLCLCDAAGPCANAVKDAQRTKTAGGTTRTLSILWGAAGLESRLETALAWYRRLLAQAGAATETAGAG